MLYRHLVLRFLQKVGFVKSLLIFLVTGCTSITYESDEVVSAIVADRMDSQVNWRICPCNDEEIQETLQTLILQELTADSAIQIALLNNPQIQATFENLGLAQANLLQAGLFSNPNFSLEIRYPPSSGFHTNIEYLITSSLLDLFLIPLRTKLATTEFEQAKLRVSNEILDLAFEVRETFYEIISLNQQIQILQLLANLSSIVRDVADRQRLVGNINTLELQLSESQNLRADLVLIQAETDLIYVKEKFYRLLGFDSDYICFIFPPLFLEFDIENFDLCALEETALDERLDLQIARFEILRLCQMLGLKEWWTYTNLQGGLAGERETDGRNFIGPGFVGELPLFNYGQADRMRIFAHLRQEQERLTALEIQIRSEVREAYKLITSYTMLLQKYHDQLIPLQQTISSLSEELYNVMGLGLNKLLESKRIELETEQQYLEGAKHYLLARVQLDRALGGNLSRFAKEALE